MKKILIAAIAVMAICKCFGQSYDTIPCIALCTDTAKKQAAAHFTMWVFMNGNDSTENVGRSENHVAYVYWQYMYVVRILHRRDEADFLNNEPQNDIFCLLDAHRKRLPPSIVVWLWKRIPK